MPSNENDDGKCDTKMDNEMVIDYSKSMEIIVTLIFDLLT